jgi:DUF1009 family protein
MWWRKPAAGEPLGLIAGAGDFPVLLAEAVSAAKRKIVLFGLKGYTPRSVDDFASEIHYFDLGALGPFADAVKNSGVKRVMLAGSVPKKRIVDSSFKIDGTAKNFLGGSRNKGDDHLLRAFEIFLRLKCGVSVIDSRVFLKKILAPRGVLTRRKPTASEWKDLRFGFRVAKGVGRMDIGQTVVVKEGVVLAVEAIEGTDQAIRRGGELGYGEAVVVKTSKPRQDLRFDLPCVGLGTLESLRAASSHVLGVEAGRTLLIDKSKLIQAADERGLTLVGI